MTDELWELELLIHCRRSGAIFDFFEHIADGNILMTVFEFAEMMDLAPSGGEHEMDSGRHSYSAADEVQKDQPMLELSASDSDFRPAVDLVAVSENEDSDW